MKKRFLTYIAVLLMITITACKQKSDTLEVINPLEEQENLGEDNTGELPFVTSTPTTPPKVNGENETLAPSDQEKEEGKEAVQEDTQEPDKLNKPTEPENEQEDKEAVPETEKIEEGRKGWISEDKTETCIDDEGTIVTFVIKDKEVLITGAKSPLPETLTIPDQIASYPVTKIEEYAFYNTSLKKLVLPEGLKVIGTRAFQKCYDLEEIQFSSTIETIEQSAFGICPSLLTMTIPKENMSYSIVEGVLYSRDKNTLVKYPTANPQEEYSILKSVTRIAEGAFSLAKNLTYVELPEKLAIIESEAFSGCIRLQIAFTPNITRIGNYAFADCYALSELVLPDSLTFLGEGAFSACEGVVSVVIPKQVARIPFAAFGSNTSLEEVIFLGAPSTIEDMSFSSCHSLMLMDIPIGTVHIGDMAFYACSNMTEITIPNTVVSFGNEIFTDVLNLTIVAPKSSAAESYAKENGFDYEEAVVDIIE